MSAYVYILSDKNRTTTFIGSTTDLSQTLLLLRQGKPPSFARKSRLDHLIYLETFPNADAAVLREQQLKKSRRIQKWKTIFSCNPLLREMYCADAELIIESAAFKNAC